MASKNGHMSSLQRVIEQAIGQGRVVGRDDDPAKEKFPELWQWLTKIYYGKDNIKSPATISIACGPEGVLASLVDRDLACSVVVQCDALEQVFEALEQALHQPNPPVRIWGKKEPHLRKRKNTG